MSAAWQVVTTIDSPEAAERIARALVDQRLAACVQIEGPCLSVYRWKEKTEESTEWMCLIKTTAELYDAVETAIQAQHHYDEPEIIATKIERGSPGYLAWIAENTRSN